MTRVVMQRTVVEDSSRRKFVPTFKADRDLVVGLTDVSRYVLVKKAPMYVDAKFLFGKSVKRRTAKRERFSRRAD